MAYARQQQELKDLDPDLRFRRNRRLGEDLLHLGIAASMTRTIRSPRTNRYTWEAKGTIDFEALAHELEQVEGNIWRLYQYIYQSNELRQLNESLTHGHSSLRYHLLLIANLIVHDFLRGVL
ncbi:MAG: hypothetical protein ACFFE8_03675 [Candidatus Heimdallarchaeota archaeon]